MDESWAWDRCDACQKSSPRMGPSKPSYKRITDQFREMRLLFVESLHDASDHLSWMVFYPIISEILCNGRS